MKKIIFAVALSALVGCATTGGSGAGGEDFNALAASAEAAIKTAKKTGGEWRDAMKILKKAQEANKKGNSAEAMKLVKKAKFQGEMGKAQSMEQANAGPWLF